MQAFLPVLALLALFVGPSALAASPDASLLLGFLAKINPADLNPQANRYGSPKPEFPVVPLLKDEAVVGWAFLTSNYVSTTGYSGKPIHIVVALDNDAVVTGVRLVKHAEPIVLVGIPEAKIRALTESYAGLDLKVEAKAGGSGHELNIISGATVTVIVIDDSIVRASLKVARRLGLGGLAPASARPETAYEINPSITDARDWASLEADGSVAAIDSRHRAGEPGLRRRRRDEGRGAAGERRTIPTRSSISALRLPAFPRSGEAFSARPNTTTSRTRLPKASRRYCVAGRGHYSFKGSGYVRGGVFDRIQLIQGDVSVRFHDRQHRRVGAIAASGAPSFTESTSSRSRPIPASIRRALATAAPGAASDRSGREGVPDLRSALRARRRSICARSQAPSRRRLRTGRRTATKRPRRRP